MVYKPAVIALSVHPVLYAIACKVQAALIVTWVLYTVPAVSVGVLPSVV